MRSEYVSLGRLAFKMQISFYSRFPVEVVMVAVSRGSRQRSSQKSRWLLFFVVLFLALEALYLPTEAHGRGRRCFGGRGVNSVRFARRNPFVFNNGFRRHFVRNNFNFDPFLDFAGSPFQVDPTQSSIIDPSLSFAFGSTRIAQDRFGNLFELTGGSVLEVRQPLLVNRSGQIIGGARFGGLLNDTFNDARFFNSFVGSCNSFNRRCSGNRLR